MKTLLWLVLLSLPILPNLWCIWHASRHAFPTPEEQSRWVRAGMFAPIIGGILYLAVGMRRARPLAETAQSGQDGTFPAADAHDKT